MPSDKLASGTEIFQCRMPLDNKISDEMERYALTPMVALRRLKRNTSISPPIYSSPVCNFSSGNPPVTASTLSCAHYDGLINDAGRKRDFDSVRRILSEGMRDGFSITRDTFKFLAKDPAVFEDLRKNLTDIDGWFARKKSHDGLVAQLSRLGLTDEALSVVKSMAREKILPTVTTFHPILNALVKKKEMSAAWRVVDLMRKCNVKPSAALYCSILMAYCVAGDVASAADVVCKMEEEGLTADGNIYYALVIGACKAGKVEGAVALMRRAVEIGVPVTYSSQLPIIKEMVWCGCYAQAMEFVRLFAGRNKEWDVECFGYLVKRLRCAKRIAEAEAVLEEMAERGLPTIDSL